MRIWSYCSSFVLGEGVCDQRSDDEYGANEHDDEDECDESGGEYEVRIGVLHQYPGDAGGSDRK